jgi:hypothetical protein
MSRVAEMSRSRAYRFAVLHRTCATAHVLPDCGTTASPSLLQTYTRGRAVGIQDLPLVIMYT